MKGLKIGIKALESIGMKLIEASVDERGSEFRVYEDSNSGLLIYLRRSFKKPNGEFLPGLVKGFAEKILWRFQEENFSQGIGRVVVVDDKLVIALVDRKYVYKVIPVLDLLKVKKVKTTSGEITVGGCNKQEIVRLKHLVAKAFSLEAKITYEEKTFLLRIRQFEDAEKERKMRAKMEARKKRVAEIMSRPQISGFPEFGSCRYGVPVLQDEWPMLKVGTGVVLVEGFASDGSPVGDKAVAFFTGREKGKPMKKATKEIILRGSKKNPKENENEDSSSVEVEFLEEIFFCVREPTQGLEAGFYPAFLTDKEGFTILKSKKLNSGRTYVALPTPDPKMVQVEKMDGEGSATLGIFPIV